MPTTSDNLSEDLQEALDILDQVWCRYEGYRLCPADLEKRVDKFLTKFGFEL